MFMFFFDGDNEMTEQERNDILTKATEFFKNNIIPSHIKNNEKLVKKDRFKVNPFLYKYLAGFFYGEVTSEAIAKVLFYPRAMGTSINTIFGNQLQKFCNEVLDGVGSTTSGIDIEFTDQTDGRKKYCQIKAGPQTINKDDVKTIKDEFGALIRLGRTNNLAIAPSDCVVGVLYGSRQDLSGNYKKIDEDYPVYIGNEFWYRLTGDEDFYEKLIDAFGEAAANVHADEKVAEIIEALAQDIEETEQD